MHTKVEAEQDTQRTVEAKMAALRERLRALGSVVVCFSGGLDSAFVLAVACEVLGDRAVGVTAVGPALAPSEYEHAVAFANSIGARHELVDAAEIEREGYVQNAPDRCFHCKSALYEVAELVRAKWSFAAIANGTNVDDLGDYRPGLDAARQSHVVSPLLDAGFTKAEVRLAARAMQLSVWDKPAAACLASRIPYGMSVTRTRLEQVAGLEAALRALGLRQIRVRHHDNIARIEVDVADIDRVVAPGIREAVVEAGKNHGFTYVTLDLGGYRTGSHNEVLDGRKLRVVD